MLLALADLPVILSSESPPLAPMILGSKAPGSTVVPVILSSKCRCLMLVPVILSSDRCQGSGTYYVYYY